MLIKSVRVFSVEDAPAYCRVLDWMTLKVPSDPTQSEFRILWNIFSILPFPPSSIWRLKAIPTTCDALSSTQLTWCWVRRIHLTAPRQQEAESSQMVRWLQLSPAGSGASGGPSCVEMPRAVHHLCRAGGCSGLVAVGRAHKDIQVATTSRERVLDLC